MVRVSVLLFVNMSFLSTALTIANAFFLNKQFYPSIVYLSKSNTSMSVIYFQVAVLSYLLFLFLRRIFFGQLRAAEIEHTQERVWHAIMETCLAFTVFRDDFSPKFVVQFVILFFVKAFHWLGEDRVDYMERSPVITVLFHARIMGILSLLSAVDSYFISHAFFTTIFRGASAQVVFGFEYAVLLTIVAHITIKYILHIHDLRSAHPWENKAVYMLYAELFTNFLRCVFYIVFAFVMIKIHTFPLFAIRPFYLTLCAFYKAVNDVIQSRRAINALNNLFLLATAQELAEGDNTCIICREEMTVENGAKKLPCNHIFHPNCLRSWFQRQQTCPTCRTDVLAQRRINNANPLVGNVENAPANNQNNIFNPAAGVFFGIQFPRQPFAAAPNQQQQQAPTPQQQGTIAGHPQQQQQQQVAPGGPLIGMMPPPSFGFGGRPFNMPPPPFGFAAGGVPPNFMRFVPPQQQPENLSGEIQPAASGTQQDAPSTSTRTDNASTAQPSTSGSLPSAPQMSGPGSFPFVPSGFLPFAFPQPPTYSGFSDAEIAEMEGRERVAVEARLQALRNISVLLDAAMMQFQQYMSIVAITNVASSLSCPSDQSQPSSSNFIPNTTTGDSPTNQAEISTKLKTSVVDTLASKSTGESSNEIRRRRLEKFVNIDQSSSTNSTSSILSNQQNNENN